VIDLTEGQTRRLDEVDRGHREFHDRVVDRRVQDFFADLDRRRFG
jgi:hypothetical protein